MATAIESQGVKLAVSSGSPTLFANIGNIVNITGPGGQANVIDVSNLDSTFREKLMGMPDLGQVTLDLNFDPDNTTHQTLRSAFQNRTLLEFRLTLTDATPATCIFNAYVLGFSLSVGVDNPVRGSITLEVTGNWTWA